LRLDRPAFHGLRTTMVALVFLALLRIKRPEALEEHAPAEFGRLLGLDRAPEVKTELRITFCASRLAPPDRRARRAAARPRRPRAALPRYPTTRPLHRRRPRNGTLSRGVDQEVWSHATPSTAARCPTIRP